MPTARPSPLLTSAVAALAVVAMASACKDRATSAPPLPAPVAVDDARRFTAELTAHLERCDPMGLVGAFDLELMTERALAGVELGPGQRRDELERHPALDPITGLCALPARYHLLAVEAAGPYATARYRRVDRRGLDYLEVHLGRSHRDGAVRVYDLYSALAGETWTASTARQLRASLARPDRTRVLERSLVDARALEQKGRLSDAREALAALPRDLRSLRQPLAYDVRLAAQLSDADFAAASATLIAAFPGDPSVELALLDAHVVRRDRAAALASAERLGRRFGDRDHLVEAVEGMFEPDE